uniref:Uncharacterized protein n=1 Tax=Rhizophora mucronata TaxID=61149 RepID=A0A2P2N899_RHIMU
MFTNTHTQRKEKRCNESYPAAGRTSGRG